MIKNNGQSTLEYLMTYGWALIVIVIAVGVLVLITDSTTIENSCQINSTQFTIVEQAISAEEIEITLRNQTTGEITIIGANGNGDFEGYGTITETNVPVGQTFKISNITVKNGTTIFQNGQITIAYETANGLPGIITAKCSGKI